MERLLREAVHEAALQLDALIEAGNWFFSRKPKRIKALSLGQNKG
jgi:hypothetical protein